MINTAPKPMAPRMMIHNNWLILLLCNKHRLPTQYIRLIIISHGTALSSYWPEGHNQWKPVSANKFYGVGFLKWTRGSPHFDSFHHSALLFFFLGKNIGALQPWEASFFASPTLKCIRAFSNQPLLSFPFSHE